MQQKTIAYLDLGYEMRQLNRDRLYSVGDGVDDDGNDVDGDDDDDDDDKVKLNNTSTNYGQ